MTLRTKRSPSRIFSEPCRRTAAPAAQWQIHIYALRKVYLYENHCGKITALSGASASPDVRAVSPAAPFAESPTESEL